MLRFCHGYANSTRSLDLFYSLTSQLREPVSRERGRGAVGRLSLSELKPAWTSGGPGLSFACLRQSPRSHFDRIVAACLSATFSSLRGSVLRGPHLSLCLVMSTLAMAASFCQPKSSDQFSCGSPGVNFKTACSNYECKKNITAMVICNNRNMQHKHINITGYLYITIFLPSPDDAHGARLLFFAFAAPIASVPCWDNFLGLSGWLRRERPFTKFWLWLWPRPIANRRLRSPQSGAARCPGYGGCDGRRWPGLRLLFTATFYGHIRGSQPSRRTLPSWIQLRPIADYVLTWRWWRQ